MNKKDIISILRKEKPYLHQRFGLLRIGLFGSFSKGHPTKESDIDLLVELSEPRFDQLAGLQIYLEEKLGQPIDLIRKRKGLSRRFQKRIEKDLLDV